MRSKTKKSALTLGPLLFNWSADRRRDFYARIADEADVNVVYLGEVVCSKREPFFEDDIYPTAERLRKAGKEVVISTLAMITLKREIAALEKHVAAGFMLEANDTAALRLLKGKPHVVGPYINVFNEGTQDFMIRNGAVRDGRVYMPKFEGIFSQEAMWAIRSWLETVHEQ